MEKDFIKISIEKSPVKSRVLISNKPIKSIVLIGTVIETLFKYIKERMIKNGKYTNKR